MAGNEQIKGVANVRLALDTEGWSKNRIPFHAVFPLPEIVLKAIGFIVFNQFVLLIQTASPQDKR